MARLASIRQPSGQELHCTQRPAFRLIGPPLAPSACGALHAELAVSAHRLGVERGHREHFLRRLVERVELDRPGEALVVAPRLEDLARSPEAGAGVDHRGAADGAADRHRDRQASRGDRHARRRGRAAGAPRADRSGSSRGPRTARTRARSRRVPPRPGSPPRRRRPLRSRRSPRRIPRRRRAAPGRRRRSRPARAPPSATAQRASKPTAVRTRSSRAQPIIASSFASSSRSR